MITIEHEGKDYDIRNSIDEITIEEFEYIMVILSNEEENLFTRWMEIISFLGLDQEVLDNIDASAFLELVSKFDFSRTDDIIQKEIEIDGVLYSCYEGEKFKIKMKDLKKIEDLIKNRAYYFARLCAFLYRREDYTESESLDNEHMQYKIEFFRNEKMSLLIPILNVVNKSLIKKFNLLFNGN